MPLRVIDMAEIASQLPHPTPFGEVISEIPEIDLLITVSGFEPRLTAVARALREANVRVREACYLTYETNERKISGQT